MDAIPMPAPRKLILFFSLLLPLSPLSTPLAFSQDWLNSLSPKSPGPFPPPPNDRSTYVLGWSVFKVGEAALHFSRPQPHKLRLLSEIHTRGTVRALFQLDAESLSETLAQGLRPLSIHQSEAYSDETLLSKLQFDSHGVSQQRHAEQRPAPKPKRFNFDPLFSPQAALLWLRSQKLQPGEVHRLVVYASSAPYLLDARVTDDTPPGNARIRVPIHLTALNEQLQPVKYRKFRSACLWFSNNTRRDLVRVEADVFIGKVWAQRTPSPNAE